MVWLEKVCLHLAIDLCTGTIIGGIFQTQETLRGYYIIFNQILENYGISVLIKTDNRTVFTYKWTVFISVKKQVKLPSTRFVSLN